MVAFSATDKTDAGIIDIECVSVKGNILPAEFGIVYSFQVANFSDIDIAQVPVTIYFNPQGSPLVEQGSTTITDIPAGHSGYWAHPGIYHYEVFSDKKIKIWLK